MAGHKTLHPPTSVRRRVPCPTLGPRLGQAFTLLELLIVIAIFTVLAAVLLPVVTRARSHAKALQCTSNLRQVCLSMIAYGADNRGRFPPAVGVPAPGRFWYDPERCGRYLMRAKDGHPGSVVGPVVTCPEDEGAERSYAMNVWVSSTVDPLTREKSLRLGLFWRPTMGAASRVILAAEKFSIYGSADTVWRSSATLGMATVRPGRRFGGNGGLHAMIPNLRFDYLKCELPYYRHRLGSNSGLAPTAPVGRVAIGYADGHVALKAHTELVRPDGTSTLDSLWSTLDPAINLPD
jgi:prepilin-type N-terminal cleavage/methylation domain-containing protein